MNKIRFAKFLLITTVVYFVIYNTHFGWNMLPESDAEKTCDYIYRLSISLGFAIYILPVFDIYESFVKKREG